MPPKARDGDVLLAVSGSWVSWAHTLAAYAAFFGALIVGVSLHYHKIVENEFYGYPQEWFPSVSATIGDRYPERSVFQVFIAITSGPRFALVALWYVLTKKPNSTLPKVVAATGIFRTLTCGGWTYVTSTDDHDWHDIFMISYLIATVPWTLGCLALSPPNPRATRYRKLFASLFFGTLVPLIYFFIQHKVHRVPGAYTTYAFFEWSLVLLDVAFDAVTALDFDGLELVVKDVQGGSSRSGAKRLADVELEKRKDQEVAQVFHKGFWWSEALDALADVYNGFVFWSMLTSLGVLVWYFPLWHMGLSGFEVFVMVTISPIFLGIGPIRRFILRNLTKMHLLSLTGLVAWVVPRPEARLFVVGYAVWMTCLSWTATFYAERSQPHKLEARICGFGVGLIASSVAKYYSQTLNPIWPVVNETNNGWNKTGLCFAILAVLQSTRKVNVLGGQPSAKHGSGVLAGLGLGGLFFGLHSLLSDSSTMILWVWGGYPVNGPLAVPHGSITILVMGLGLWFGLFYPSLARGWTFWAVGSIGAAILTTRGNWLGYSGAVVLAFYLMAMTPILISSATRYGPAKTFGLGFFVYNFMVLFSVWVVAYAFVPGGPLVRERTDWVMAAAMVLLGAGVFSATSFGQTGPKGRKAQPGSRRQSSYYLYVLLILQLLSAAIAYLRFPSYNYVPYHPNSNVLTAGIWTTHFTLDNPMWDSSRRIRDLVKELELDVIGLLESDTQRIIMGNRDATQFLAEDLGMYVDYGPGPNKNTWGAALLSKFPIVNSTHHLVPSPVGELAPAIHAVLDAYGTLVDVYVYHGGQEEDVEDRRVQAAYMSQLMGRSARPAVLLSYLIVKPGEGNYNTFVSAESGMKDIDPSDWDRWCEYVLYKGMRRVGYARVSRGTITDTELQAGKFVVGQPETTNDVVAEDTVPQDLRFPALFRGAGVRGHRYHVFDEPRYYA